MANGELLLNLEHFVLTAPKTSLITGMEFFFQLHLAVKKHLSLSSLLISHLLECRRSSLISMEEVSYNYEGPYWHGPSHSLI